jgi:hypothetical protein
MYRHFHALLGRQYFDNNVEIQISILYQVILVGKGQNYKNQNVENQKEH